MKLFSRYFSLFRFSTSGSTAVEFALVIPVFLLVLFGSIEYGRLLWVQNAIQYAVERAARCAAMSLTACTTESATKTFAVTQVHAYTVATTAFTVAYQCTPTPSAGCTACGVANTKGVLVSANVPFTPILSSSSLLPF